LVQGLCLATIFGPCAGDLVFRLGSVAIGRKPSFCGGFSVGVLGCIRGLKQRSVACQQQKEKEREGQEPASHDHHLADDPPGLEVSVKYEVPKDEGGREALGHRSDQAPFATRRIKARPGLGNHQREIRCAEKANEELGRRGVGRKADQLKPAEGQEK